MRSATKGIHGVICACTCDVCEGGVHGVCAAHTTHFGGLTDMWISVLCLCKKMDGTNWIVSWDSVVNVAWIC